MSSPAPSRLSDQMLPLMVERLERCRRDPGMGAALLARALESFGSDPGPAAAAALVARIRAERPRVEHVILVPSRDIWMVVEETVLATVLPPESTIRLFYGQPGLMDAGSCYPTFDLGQSLPLLLEVLRALAPRTLYARGSAQYRIQHLVAAVKASRPELFLTFEVYDYAGMFDDETLACWGCTPELAEANRDAEAYLGLHADFIIDKTPGGEWEAAARAHLGPPRVAWFPALGTRWRAPAAPAPRDSPGLRILCAGSMPYFHNYVPGAGFPRWSYQNIIDPVVLLAREPDIRVDLFNASHDPALARHWPAFEGYAGLFPPGRVGYHPRIPLAEVQARIPGYDFGMFLFQASTVPVDYPLQQSLPNRCMSYVCGGLPLIINTEMRYLAGLVERFQAGIALAGHELADLPRRLRAADLGALRAGAAAMHQHLVEHNREALETFRARLSDLQDRVG